MGELYSLVIAANHLGISLRTLYRLLENGDLPSVRIRGRRLVQREALIDFVKTRSTAQPNA